MKCDRKTVIVCWVLVGLLCGTTGVFAAAPAAAPPQPPAPAKPAAEDANKPAEDPNKPETIVVARIQDYTITKAQLKDRLAQEIPPRREYEGEPNRVVTVPGVLDLMIAEKAMMIEGRKLGYLEDKEIKPQVQRQRRDNLIRLMLEDYVNENLTVTDAEVQERQKAEPNVPVEQVKAKLQRTKVNVILDRFYTQLLEKFKVKKLTENFAKASQAHQRLLNQPAKPRDRGVYWITGPQIEEELTPEEKSLVLATFEGGTLTLPEWFGVLNDMVPPGRPKDLDTPEGVDKFTDRALQGPILMAEALARGYDKNQKHLEYMRMIEDETLKSKVLSAVFTNPVEPNDSQIKAYFEKNAGRFATSASMKVDQIWCKDQATAQQVKEKLAGGASFESLKSEFSIRKEEPVHDTWPTSEGVFWADLNKAEPNTIAGPMKGFCDPKLKWRVVKVLEKKPAVAVAYADSMKERVKEALMTDRMMEKQHDLEKQMLTKYPHEVYAEKIKDIDPLEVPADNTPAR